MEKQTKLLYSKPFISIFVWIPEGYSTQQALLALIESRKESLDNKGFGGSTFMDF